MSHVFEPVYCTPHALTEYSRRRSTPSDGGNQLSPHIGFCPSLSVDSLGNLGFCSFLNNFEGSTMNTEDSPPRKRMKIDIDTDEPEDVDESGDVEVNPICKLESNTVDDNCDEESDSALSSVNPMLKVENELKSNPSTSQYNNVTLEELQKLREFQVLDEVNEEDSKDEDDSDASDKSDDLPDEEIEKMLEEDLPEGFKGVPKPKERSYITRQKIVLEGQGDLAGLILNQSRHVPFQYYYTQNQHVVYKNCSFKEKGINHFEVLPLDWMMVRHCSGMPVYMHRVSRVCTLSKPYFLGKGNTRRHDIPISAIPCLAYRKALEEEEKQKEIDISIAEQITNGTWANDQSNDHFTNRLEKPEKNQQANDLVINCDSDQIDPTTDEQPIFTTDLTAEPILSQTESQETNNADEQTNSSESIEIVENEPTDNGNRICPLEKDLPSRKPVVLPGGIVMPPPRVETVNTSWKTQHLSAEQMNDYCKKLFKFKNVNIMHFKRWADRRKYVKARKTLQYPTLPEGTKLITIPAQSQNGQENNGKSTKRDWVMNMNGCSYLSVFHEYVRRALQKQPVYEFKQLENAATPYQATVYIGGMQYGVGHGSSKRQAKSAAARASIHVLIPEMRDELEEHTARAPPAAARHQDPDFSFFDYVGIEDPRIAEFCAATSEPSPHAILRTCLLRNFGAGDRHIHTEMKKLEFQKMELTMRVGKHSATVTCKNKKQAKQRASQAILQALHPHIKSWGSLLRLYGSRSVKSCKEKKLEEQQITLLQDKAQQNEPNYAVLEKLRNEMRKLKERDEAVVPIGTLLVAEDLPTHSGSMLNNVDL